MVELEEPQGFALNERTPRLNWDPETGFMFDGKQVRHQNTERLKKLLSAIDKAAADSKLLEALDLCDNALGLATVTNKQKVPLFLRKQGMLFELNRLKEAVEVNQDLIRHISGFSVHNIEVSRAYARMAFYSSRLGNTQDVEMAYQKACDEAFAVFDDFKNQSLEDRKRLKRMTIKARENEQRLKQELEQAVALHDEIQVLESKLTEAQDSLAQETTEKLQIGKDLFLLTEQLNGEIQVSETLEKELNNVEETYGNMEGGKLVDDMQRELKRLRIELDGANQTLQIRDREVSEMATNMQAMQEGNISAGASSEIDRLRQQIEEKTGEIDRLQDQIEKNTNTLNSASAEATQLRQQIEEERRTLEERNSELAEVTKNMKAMQKGNVEASVSAEMDRLRHELEDKKSAVEEKNRQIADMTQNMQEMQRGNVDSSVSAEMDRLRQELADKSRALEERNKEAAEMARNMKVMQDGKVEASVSAEMDRLGDEVEQKKRLLEGKAREVVDLAKELKASKENEQTNASRLRQMEEEKTDTKVQIQNFRVEVETLRAKLESKQSEVDALKELKSGSAADISTADVKSEVEEMKRQIAQLTRSVSSGQIQLPVNVSSGQVQIPAKARRSSSSGSWHDGSADELEHIGTQDVIAELPLNLPQAGSTFGHRDARRATKTNFEELEHLRQENISRSQSLRRTQYRLKKINGNPDDGPTPRVFEAFGPTPRLRSHSIRNNGTPRVEGKPVSGKELARQRREQGKKLLAMESARNGDQPHSPKLPRTRRGSSDVNRTDQRQLREQVVDEYGHTELIMCYADSVLSYSTQYDTENHAVENILGEPRHYPNHGDFAQTWAPMNFSSDKEFVELTFSRAMLIQEVIVYETYNPGSVVKVAVMDPSSQQWETVWSGHRSQSSAGEQARKFKVPCKPTAFTSRMVRIELHTVSYSQFDAVQIIGTAN